jgi:hypothetical protein
MSGESDDIKNRDFLVEKLTPLQIEIAQKLAGDCLKSDFKQCD